MKMSMCLDIRTSALWLNNSDLLQFQKLINHNFQSWHARKSELYSFIYIAQCYLSQQVQIFIGVHNLLADIIADDLDAAGL